MNSFELKEKSLIGNVTSDIFIGFIKNEEEMNKNIIDSINNQGDKQNHNTNVKAQMTDWEMWNYPGFNKFCDILTNVVKELAILKGTKNVKFNIVDMWGCKYKDGDYTISHNHWPSVWSLVYYLYPPKDSPELIFTDFNYKIKPEHGMIVIFPGHIEHKVDKKYFKGHRYVVSANVR